MAVGEDVAEVRTAIGAEGFGTGDAVGEVALSGDEVFGKGSSEPRPG